MTNTEFSDTFDTLLNSYGHQGQFGEQASKNEITLDEYEKSVLLTQAQDFIVKSYFDSTLNSQRQGFDDSARRQVDFSSLISTAVLSSSTSDATHFDDRGVLYDLPKRKGKEGTSASEVLFILNEQLQYVPQKGDLKTFVIIPIHYREYDRLMSKAYAQPLKKQAWRLFQNNSTGFDLKSEIIPRWDYKEAVDEGKGELFYKIRYIRRPCPIILGDLPEGLEIDGEATASSCELNPILHMDILNKAIALAIQTRSPQSVQESQNRQ